MYLLDSDIATHILHAQERVMERLLAVDRANVAITLVTRVELLRGRLEAIRKAATGDELLRAVAWLARTDALIGQFALVTVTADVADRFDQLRANKKLNKMDAGDRLQAAIALANGATLVTRNTKDYAAVPGLTLEDWAA